MQTNGSDGREPEARAPQPVRRTLVSADEECLTLAMPPSGLGTGQVVRAVLLALGAVALLYLAVRIFDGTAWAAPRFLGVLGGLFLLAGGVYVALDGLLDRALVRVSAGGIEVTHSFPWRRTGRIGRRAFHGIVIGRPRLVRRGYFCHDWGRGRLSLVALADQDVEYFGAGLPPSEQTWLKELIEEKLPPLEAAPSRPSQEATGDMTQPPEGLWRDVTRYSSYVLLAGLVGLALLLVVRAGQQSIVFALLVLLFSGTCAILGYRNYRLELAASGWHRAVVKSLAGIMELGFSAVDTAGIAPRTPDFAFFAGPRRLYNVAWDEQEPHNLIAFDYTSAGRFWRRNAVGCALRVQDMSGDTVSIRPTQARLRPFQWGGLRMPEYPELDEQYHIRVENEGRARALLGPEVVVTLLDWKGASPRPWVCMAGGMVGLSIPRKHAENDRTMREFYEYGQRIQRTLEDCIARLREQTSSD